MQLYFCGEIANLLRKNSVLYYAVNLRFIVKKKIFCEKSSFKALYVVILPIN